MDRVLREFREGSLTVVCARVHACVCVCVCVCVMCEGTVKE